MKRYDEAFKKKVVAELEADTERGAMSRIGKKHKVSDNSLGKWREQYGSIAQVNGSKPKPKSKPKVSRKSQLMQRIEDLEVELLMLKEELADIVIDESTAP